jgi:adenylate cyclase
MLNEYFEIMVEIVFKYEGTLDKFMGDEIMAVWGAPFPCGNPELRATLCGLRMTRETKVAPLAPLFDSAGEQLRIRVGVASGDVLAGNMGSAERMSYTVIGDAVNLASRLEGLTARYGVGIIASDRTRALAPGFTWQELDRVRVKGKAHAVTVHTPLGPAGERTAALAQELGLWNPFLAAWRRQDWDRCDVLLLNLQRQNAEKVLYRQAAERVAFMRAFPPGADWDGISEFDSATHPVSRPATMSTLHQ